MLYVCPISPLITNVLFTYGAVTGSYTGSFASRIVGEIYDLNYQAYITTPNGFRGSINRFGGFVGYPTTSANTPESLGKIHD